MKHYFLFVFILIGALQARAYRDEVPNYGEIFKPSTLALKARPIGEARLQDHLGARITVSRMSAAGSGVVFSWLQLSNLPFMYAKDCCHSRAYLMAEWLAAHKIMTAKIFVFGNLNFKSPVYGDVPWEFHVAPAVLDEHNRWVILDPSTQNRPVQLQEWLAAFAGPGSQYKILVANRYVYGDRNLTDPAPPNWNGYYSNMAQGELLGCEAAQNRHP